MMPRKGKAKRHPELENIRHHIFDCTCLEVQLQWTMHMNAKVHQFAWTSRCQPRRVLNSSERRIIAREATWLVGWLVGGERRRSSNFVFLSIDKCNNDENFVIVIVIVIVDDEYVDNDEVDESSMMIDEDNITEGDAIALASFSLDNNNNRDDDNDDEYYDNG